MAHCVDSTWILKSCYPRNGAGSRQSFVTLVPIVSLRSDTQIVCEKLSLVQLEKPPVRLRCRESLARKLTRWKIPRCSTHCWRSGTIRFPLRVRASNGQDQTCRLTFSPNWADLRRSSFGFFQLVPQACFSWTCTRSFDFLTIWLLSDRKVGSLYIGIAEKQLYI